MIGLFIFDNGLLLHCNIPYIVYTGIWHLNLNLGPSHPSAHGVLSLLICILSEVIIWLDVNIGLLHSSSELLLESSLITISSGYLARLDYVNHIQFEFLLISITVRYIGVLSSNISILSHISIMANHILNIICSLGDLGCISFILWGFEDSELIFTLVETITGNRMHNQLDNFMSIYMSRYLLYTMYDITCSNWDILIELILLRHNLTRLLNVVIVECGHALGLNYSGVLLISTGVTLDMRVECFLYISCTISVLIGGSLACSLISLLIRIHIYEFFLLFCEYNINIIIFNTYFINVGILCLYNECY